MVIYDVDIDEALNMEKKLPEYQLEVAKKTGKFSDFIRETICL